MVKSLRKVVLLVLLICGCGVGWTQGKIELIAPGGGEMDLKQNLIKYYASGSLLVQALWDNNILEAGYLEYYRDREFIKADNQVQLTQKKPVTRVLKSSQITVDMKQDFFTAKKEVNLVDENTSVSGNLLEWDRKNDQFKMTGNPEIVYKDWKITGERIEGQLNKGFITIFGPVHAANNETNIQAGKMIFQREIEQFTLQENPVVIRGKNEMTASEMYYDLKTKKVTANGEVKSRIIDENR
jgi:lipopolysaccharide export system protein LptA